MKELLVFPIGIVAESLGVHPETIRVWERHGIISPERRRGRRFFGEADLKRLKFIKSLMAKELNLPAIRHYLRMYPCWQMDDCPACMHRSELAACSKPCWRDEGTYCQVNGDENVCSRCKYHHEEKASKPQ